MTVTRSLRAETTPSMGTHEPTPNPNPNGPGEPPVTEELHPLPQQIGRYRVERMLGQGGFGCVYLARDDQLQRHVAVKVPHPRLVSRPEDAETYLTEARTVASLDHRNIVPVHDVGATDEFPCFIVSKYVDGDSLATCIRESRLPYRDSAELVAVVAEALHYAHKQGLVHRDIKPGNILIDSAGRPYLVDFGLALRDQDLDKRQRFAGTPAYMSPEQARGEGHRVDGRSDVFSLGVVLYELLVGRRPFHGEGLSEILDAVATCEPKPPRQITDDVPKELERICLKALSKRASERYTTAGDFAEDLRHFLDTVPETALSRPVPPSAQDTAAAETKAVSDTPPATPGSDSQPIKIVPKGLRCFDEHDADFFLELLPGPRDRNGLPESIRFWKTRIEELDADATFSVGLIYGPSGCGKSSLVRAGLLPRLVSHVVSVYVEATPNETEKRLLNGLRKRSSGLPNNLSLKETLAALRRGEGIPHGRKVLIVLDQFEQWLHANKDDENAELVQALRQCDGGHVQCIVMVRDDFWLAVSRFTRDLEVRLVEGQNSGLVDLFDLDHSRRVLGAFGTAFGRLPENPTQMIGREKEFLEQAVVGLARDGRVVCVRLSLFAEMMKGKPWVPASLRQVGGSAGVGVSFLEETFGASTAPPEHRLHQQAARAVLKALLPESGTDIKGGVRSYEDLLDASGYASRPSEFEQLIHVLDHEVRLITPTDPEGMMRESDSPESALTGCIVPLGAGRGCQYYQLTHDYLVPSLREWLTRKQRETRKGRAELKLDERTAAWTSVRESKQLPTFWEWLSIRALTDPKQWTSRQRVMMSKATRFHGLRTALALAAIVVLVCFGAVVRTQVARQKEATRIEGLVGRLVSAEPNQIPDIVKELDTNPKAGATFLLPLVSASATTIDEKRSQLHARLARVSRDPSLVEPLVEELLSGKVTYVLPIRQLMRPYAGQLTERFRRVLREEAADAQRRFRAALALADYVPESDAAWWTEKDLKFVAEQLVSSNAEFQPLLRDALRPIRGRLLEDLERIFADAKATDAQRLSTANAFADYAAGDIRRLSQLLTVATPEQFAVLYPIVAASPSAATIEDLGKIAATLPPAELGSVERVPYGQRRANAAITLLRLGEREKVLPVFDMTDDPEALTQFIFRCRPRGVGADVLLDCLQLVGDAPKGQYPRHTRYALLLALGEFTLEEIPASRRDALLKELADWYRQDPSSGVHGATGWLLRKWSQLEVARQVDQTPVPYAPDREWFTLAITVTPTAPPKPKEKPATENARTESNAAKPEKSTPSKTGQAEKTGTAKEKPAPAEKTKLGPSAELLPPKTFYYTFIVFPAGEYTIGSTGDEVDRQKDEVRHPVKLIRRFAMLDREITFEELVAFSPQYADFIQQYDAKPLDAGFGANWYDSVGFCRWLGQQSGLLEEQQAYAAPEALDKDTFPREPNPSANWAPRDWPVELGRRGFRLPTEAEWEVATRAGVRTAYGYGSDSSLLGRFGWYVENSGRRVHPPRELRPSVRGVFDLHGNLFEWTHDWSGSFNSEAVTDPRGPQGGSDRVHRSGAWGNAAAFCRTAFRSPDAPTARADSHGFRLALSPSGAAPEAGADK